MKDKFYNISNFLQIVVTKNIPFFIALGLFNLLNLKLNNSIEIIEFLIKYMIPFSISYTTGAIIDKKYGSIVGVLTSIIFLIKCDSYNILIIILISFVSSSILKNIKNKIIVKKFYNLEMLLINLIIPFISIIIGFSFIFLNQKLGEILNIFWDMIVIKSESLIFIMIITPLIEISKIFFLNNIVNHGILFFLGYSEILKKGNSLFFLLETNPGPGLGVLLAYYFINREKEMYNYIFLEFIGGIHEIYFPFILKNLKLVFPLILGGLVGNFSFYFFNITLHSLPSPGSIILIILFAKSKLILTILSIFLSVFFSFLISCIILIKKKNYNLKSKNYKINLNGVKKLKKIGVVCIGGVGTSTIGKNLLLKEFKLKHYLNIEIDNYSINEVPSDVQIIITHKELKHKVKKIYSDKKIIVLENYMDKDFYKDFVIEYIEIEKLKNYKSKFIIEMNKKREKNIEIKNAQIIHNKIALINKKKYNELIIQHYPYGTLINNIEIYLVINLSYDVVQNKQIISKLNNMNKRQLEEIEIISTENELLGLLT